MKMKRTIALCLTLALCASLAIGGTMAYLSDTDSDVNVMTMGSVYIEQHEKDRAGNDFVDQPLYPAVYEGDTPDAADGWYNNDSVLDKIVTVENTGRSEAYVRTIFAFEKDVKDVIELNLNKNGKWDWNENTGIEVTIGENTYTIVIATYSEALAAKATTEESLKQVYMNKKAGNDDIANFGDTYEIIALSQAVQTNGFADAKAAFEAAFQNGNDLTTEMVAEWLKATGTVPVNTVSTAAELQAALAAGGTVILDDDIVIKEDDFINDAASIAVAMFVNKDTTLDLNGKKITVDGDATAIHVHNADLTIIGDGAVELNTKSKHLLWAKGASTVDIMSGTFTTAPDDCTVLYASGNTAYDPTDDYATINVYGGTFVSGNPSDGQDNANVMNHGVGKINYYGGTFNWHPANDHDHSGNEHLHIKVADGYKVVQLGDNYIVIEGEGNVPVKSSDELVEALENGENVVLTKDVKIDPAGMSNAYGTTGINVKNGQTIDGNGNTLDIKGAGGTWDSGINTTGGIIKNLTVTGSFRGIFINHNSTHSERVILDNVTIDGTTYTISCDQGMNQGLTATNSTFKGWTSYAATLGDAKFINCYFGEGSSGYSFCRPYAPTEFVGCDFEEGFEMDPRAAVTFENCKLNGVALTAENLATLVTSNISNATVK